ncbi:hypothetical protein OJ998_12305 [Solirubrobacter taibaiensis]|nr:hypothetical protein [Solirubrobacter taibaiensis]
MFELMISLGAVVALVGAWGLYQTHRGRGGLRELMDRASDPAAVPPETAVPVDSDLVRRLYATREWRETEQLLSPDFVLVLPDGRRAGAQALEESTAIMETYYVNPHATVEAIYADFELPSVLYVRDVARMQPLRGKPFDARAWTRLVVAPCGTRIRELGPTNITTEAAS